MQKDVIYNENLRQIDWGLRRKSCPHSDKIVKYSHENRTFIVLREEQQWIRKKLGYSFLH